MRIDTNNNTNLTNDNTNNIIEKELCYKLNGIFYKVQNQLGKMLKEKQYADAVEILLKKEKIPYKREVEIPIKFENDKIEGNILDFLVENKIPLDIKAKKYITKEDYKQMQRYLKATNLKIGLIINFHEESIKPKRVINPEYDKRGGPT